MNRSAIQRIRDTFANVHLSTVYDNGCTARVISSGGELEYKVLLFRDKETGKFWGSCDCPRWRHVGATDYPEKWCKHIIAVVSCYAKALRETPEGVDAGHATD